MKKKSQPLELVKTIQMFVVPIKNNRFELRDGSESMYGGVVIASGSKDAMVAAAKLIAGNSWKLITCVSPNGRIDCHGTYGNRFGCAFCNQPL